MKPLIIGLLVLIYSCSNYKNDYTINLSGRKLKEIPDSVLSNKNITILNLGSSEVVFFPPLSAQVDTNTNGLSVLPDEIGNLSNLNTLILNSNKLTNLPSSISNLKKLEVLDLSKNSDLHIVKEIDKIKDLPNLKVLKIVDVKMNRQELELIENTLSSRVKIIYSPTDYFDQLK